jgi:hypothetical protein
MAKKPSLKVVGQAASSPPRPPRKLGAPGRQLWDRVQREFDVSDSAGIMKETSSWPSILPL